jgi:pyrroloquinoline quinone (PQQ) biosynthesis protein C
MNKEELANNEIQKSVFSEKLRAALLGVLNNPFFTGLANGPVSKEGYRFFVKEKYSAVGYFINLLENAEHVSEDISHNLAEVFRSNRLDELGYFAGVINHEYKHETWRLRSLEAFGVFKDDLKGLQLEGSKKHEVIMVELSKSKNVFEVIGGMLFLELFVVYEMKNLIAAFERDLPELFPRGGYSYDRMPFNTQEYWYGHALHDTWHYRAIEEAVIAALGNQNQSDEALNSLMKGIDEVATAKNALYSKELIEKMKSLA